MFSDVIDIISANIINERNPTCYGTDKRWANHLYPVYVTETFVKSKYISDSVIEIMAKTFYEDMLRDILKDNLSIPENIQ